MHAEVMNDLCARFTCVRLQLDCSVAHTGSNIQSVIVEIELVSMDFTMSKT